MKNFTSVINLFVLFFCNGLVQAQIAPVVQWEKSLGGSNYDQANSIQQTLDGGFIVAGYSESNDGDVSGNHGGPDYWIVKLDSSGRIVWQKSLGTAYDDEANSIQQTYDGGFIVAGWSSTLGAWIIKLDAFGNIIWEKSLFGIPNCIQQTKDDGYIFAGSSYSLSGTGLEDYWIVKLDSIGNILWQKYFGTIKNDVANSIQQTSDGGFIVAGYSESFWDYWILRLDSAGNLLWEKSLGGAAIDEPFSVRQTTDHGFIIAGWSYSFDVPGHHASNGSESTADYYVVKLDSDGNVIWQKSFGGSGDDFANSVEQTSDGGYILAGSSQSTDGDVTGNHSCPNIDCNIDYWIVKLDAGGNLIWQESLGGSFIDEAYSIRQTRDGGFIVAGQSGSNDGDVSGNHSNSYDYWIVKLSPEIITSTPLQVVNSVSVYPNPTLAQLTIHLSFPSNESTVSVYDVQGRNMNGEYTIDDFTSGNSIQLNTQHLPAGFYTIQITNKKNGQMEIGKFVKE